MEWMEECFEPFTRSHFRSEYRLLIVDGHAFQVSTEFITFTRAYKIIYLCLPSDSTHLLQLLDVSVFATLKQNYKKLLYEKTCFSTYNIDKTDFISLIQKARRQSINPQNIQSAWETTGLIPYNPAVVFQNFLVYSKDNSASDINDTGASSNTLIQTRFFSEAIPLTPRNIDQVTEVEKLVSLFWDQTLDSLKLILLHKTLKAARLAIADRVILNCTNTELLAANTQKKQRAELTEIQYSGQGAHVLSMKDVEDRKQLAENKKKDKEAKRSEQKKKQDNRYFLQASKDLIRLGPDLIYWPNPSVSSKNTQSPGLSARNKKRGDSTFINAFQDLLQIEPDLFEDLVLDDAVSYTPAQIKGKGVFRRKNTTWSIQAGLEVLEEEREVEVSKICISLRGRIICNTCKM